MTKTPIIVVIKRRINRVNWLRKILVKLPNLMHRLHPLIPMSFTLRLFYYIRMGERLDLNYPKDLNQKLQWLKVYYRDPLYVQCADKYRVREYVASQGYDFILNELYGVYKDARDIDFQNLPDQFVLKCNHASGTNILCDDKNDLDKIETVSKLNKWLKIRNGFVSGEYHYNYIKPRIVAEKFLLSDTGEIPADYKVYCFNGKPYCIAAYIDRDEKSFAASRRSVFDFDWNPIDCVISKFYTDPNQFMKPKTIKQMYKIAEQLSTPFPFVRVDFYEIDGKIVFGELTFFPTGGFTKGFTRECLMKMGDILKLPRKSKIRRWVK